MWSSLFSPSPTKREPQHKNHVDDVEDEGRDDNVRDDAMSASEISHFNDTKQIRTDSPSQILKQKAQAKASARADRSSPYSRPNTNAAASTRKGLHAESKSFMTTPTRRKAGGIFGFVQSIASPALSLLGRPFTVRADQPMDESELDGQPDQPAQSIESRPPTRSLDQSNNSSPNPSPPRFNLYTKTLGTSQHPPQMQQTLNATTPLNFTRSQPPSQSPITAQTQSQPSEIEAERKMPSPTKQAYEQVISFVSSKGDAKLSPADVQRVTKFLEQAVDKGDNNQTQKPQEPKLFDLSASAEPMQQERPSTGGFKPIFKTLFTTVPNTDSLPTQQPLVPARKFDVRRKPQSYFGASVNKRSTLARKRFDSVATEEAAVASKQSGPSGKRQKTQESEEPAPEQPSDDSAAKLILDTLEEMAPPPTTSLSFTSTLQPENLYEKAIPPPTAFVNQIPKKPKLQKVLSASINEVKEVVSKNEAKSPLLSAKIEAKFGGTPAKPPAKNTGSLLKSKPAESKPAPTVLAAQSPFPIVAAKSPLKPPPAQTVAEPGPKPSDAIPGFGTPLTKSQSSSVFATNQPAAPSPQVAFTFSTKSAVIPSEESKPKPAPFAPPKPATTALIPEPKPEPPKTAEKPMLSSKLSVKVEVFEFLKHCDSSVLDEARKEAVSSLPPFSFPNAATFSFCASLDATTRSAIAAESLQSLPSFDFQVNENKPQQPKPTNSMPFKFPTPPGWTCQTCLIQNASDSQICASCETPKVDGSKKPELIPPVPSKEATASAPSFKGFSFPAPPAGWTCDACLVNNKVDATKCVSCETPRVAAAIPAAEPVSTVPKATAVPIAAPTGFKAPPQTGWKCDECWINNKDGAFKCISCETPKPSGSQPAGVSGLSPPVVATDSSSGSTGQKSFGETATEPVGGFVFGGSSTGSTTGFKFAAPPATNWTCDACMVSNKEGATVCISCETPKAGSTPTDAVKAPAAPPVFGGFQLKLPGEPATPAASTGFKFNLPAQSVASAATGTGFKFTLPAASSATETTVAVPETPPVFGGFSFTPKAAETPITDKGSVVSSQTWTCDTCLVVNKPDVTKCIACETQKPGAVETSSPKPPVFGEFKFCGDSSAAAPAFKFSPSGTGSSTLNPIAPEFKFGGSTQGTTGFTFGSGKAPDQK